MVEYIKDGKEIYRQSFATIRKEADFSNLPPALEVVAVRLIHACGMVDIVKDLDYSDNFVEIARSALKKGAKILCDSQMVAHGITRSRLPAQNSVICTLNDPEVLNIAHHIQNTRSAAALELWQNHLAGGIVAIGNAPTALFYLLELLDRGFPKPAAILGFPVGFVGAIESKQALAQDNRGVPFLTIHGRRGGSAMAVAALNSLAQEQEL